MLWKCALPASSSALESSARVARRRLFILFHLSYLLFPQKLDVLLLASSSPFITLLSLGSRDVCFLWPLWFSSLWPLWLLLLVDGVRKTFLCCILPRPSHLWLLFKQRTLQSVHSWDVLWVARLCAKALSQQWTSHANNSNNSFLHIWYSKVN